MTAIHGLRPPFRPPATTLTCGLSMWLLELPLYYFNRKKSFLGNENLRKYFYHLEYEKEKLMYNFKSLNLSKKVLKTR
jgi:hypothetical protein